MPPFSPAHALRRTRRLHDKTQTEIAQILGVEPSTISKLERGENALTIPWINRLADAIGCHPLDIVDLEMPTEERELLAAFRALPPLRRTRVLELVRMLQSDD